MSKFVQIDKLTKRLGSFTLGPVDLEINRGEYLVLLGPTGSGKSSLLRCLAGISRPDDGIFVLDGKAITMKPPEKRGIGLVPQTGELFPHLTVKQNVGFGLRYLKLSRSEKQARLDHYLELFGLTAMANRSAATLSGGESKKTAMARSLITGPRLLLLDEPLGMLDHNGRKEMLKILRMVHGELKTTTIHVTHDRHEAWGVAGNCAVMNQGEILQSGSVNDLFRAPSSRFVAEFLGGVNLFPAKFTGGKAALNWIELEISSHPGVDSGWILLRPERIRLVPENKSHRISGKVSAVRDFGEFLEVEVVVNNEVSLTIHASIDQSSLASTGKTVYLDWAKDAIHPGTGN